MIQWEIKRSHLFYNLYGWVKIVSKASSCIIQTLKQLNIIFHGDTFINSDI